jgi:flagellar motor switch protein FliG
MLFFALALLALTLLSLPTLRDLGALLLALGEEHSLRLWEMLDEEEIREISQIMSNLGTVSAVLVEKLLIEFVSQMSTTGSLMGSYESTERLLQRFLDGEKVGQIMEEIRGPAGRTMWDKLANVNESVLANYLKNEYPQTVAVVLSKIKPEHAARVLSALPEEFALEVVQRMLRMESVQKDILDKVEQTLRIEFMSNLARTAKRDSHEMMAEIFNNFDRQTESRFITALEERSRNSAERIKALMFTFEDLVGVPETALRDLLGAVDKKTLALALKGASDGVKTHIFKAMSSRAVEMLKEDPKVETRLNSVKELVRLTKKPALNPMAHAALANAWLRDASLDVGKTIAQHLKDKEIEGKLLAGTFAQVLANDQEPRTVRITAAVLLGTLRAEAKDTVQVLSDVKAKEEAKGGQKDAELLTSVDQALRAINLAAPPKINVKTAGQ